MNFLGFSSRQDLELLESINTFYQDYMDDFLNYHRFCAFATDYVNEKGKVKKKYEIYMTPIQKFLSLSNCEQYLKEGVTLDSVLLQQKKFTHLQSVVYNLWIYYLSTITTNSPLIWSLCFSKYPLISSALPRTTSSCIFVSSRAIATRLFSLKISASFSTVRETHFF